MANSDVMRRLGRLETSVAGMARDVADLKAVAQRTAEILADHSEHLSGLQRTMDERLGGVADRLDRLIAVTIQERTAGVERLGDIERRLARLEQRVGI